MPGKQNFHRLIAALLLLAAALAAGGCHREPPTRPRNVIFVLVDTLRADRLGSYGYGRSTSPNFDAFARGAARFAAGRSQASCTFPSANSILASRWPGDFLGQPDGAMGIPEGIPSLAEILHARGFRTVAVSASSVVRRSPSRFNPHGGYGRGFDVFDEDCVWKSADCVNQKALPHLRRGERPLFAYLHYLDPHGPYQPPDTPAARPSRFAAGRPDKEWVRRGDPNPIGDWLYKGKPNPGFTPADVRYLSDLYDEEVAFFDTRFAELLEMLRSSGLLDESIVIFAADHGEEFLEHGHVKHCRTLFDTSIHTPLVVRVPGVAAREVPAPVENLDLVPTVLDYLGLDRSPYRFAGRSLRPLMEGSEAPARVQFALQGSLRSASDGRHKLVQDLAAGTWSLYDLAADPGETTDVLRRERRAFARLRQALDGWLATTEGTRGLDRSREAEKRLRSLGYIE
jgi:arylsulfatase